MGGSTQPHDPSPLLMRMSIETSAAIISAFSVAPAISIVDKAIVSNASGLEPLVPSIINSCKSAILKPKAFFTSPSFLFIWGVYSGTYIVANNVEAICYRNKQDPLLPKFFSSSAANISLSILKDKAFAKLFANPATAVKAPMSVKSMGLFGVRDSMTILASFSLPPIIAQHLKKKFNLQEGHANKISQLICPVAMQIFSCPLHLYGLDIYNRPDTSAKIYTSGERISFIKQEYLKTTLARMARILPAFGFGGVINTEIRTNGQKWLREKYSIKNEL